MAFYSLQRVFVIALLQSLQLFAHAEVPVGKVIGVIDSNNGSGKTRLKKIVDYFFYMCMI